MINRRGLFGVLAGFIAAPLVVKAANIMPIRVMPSFDILALLEARMRDAERVMLESISTNLYSDGTSYGDSGLASLLSEKPESMTSVGVINRAYDWNQVSGVIYV